MMCGFSFFFFVFISLNASFLPQKRIKNELYQLQGPNPAVAKKVEVNHFYGIKSITQIKREIELLFGSIEFIFQQFIIK